MASSSPSESTTPATASPEQRDNSECQIKDSVIPWDTSILKSPYQARKRWVIPEYDNASDPNLPMPVDSARFAGGLHQADVIQMSNDRDPYPTDENFVPGSGQNGAGLTSAHIQHISQKFREILRMKARQDSTFDEQSAVLNSLDNFPSQSLSGLVSAVLGDNKQHEEVAGLVEYMLKKVLEEFERRLLVQNEQVMKLKSTLKEHLMREDRFASRAKVLETLAAGTGEEVKILSRQLQKIKMEKRQAEDDKRSKDLFIEKLLKDIEERQSLVESLKTELERLNQINRKHIEQLELEKHDFEQVMEGKLNERDALLEDAQRKIEELQAVSAVEVKALKKKDEQYQSFLVSQLQSFQDAKESLHVVKQDVFSLQTAWQENFENLEGELAELVNAASGYHKVLAENRRLYNEVQDLRGNIRVYCRVRPFLPGQTTKYNSVEFIGDNGDLLICNPLKQQGKDARKMFNFNKVFCPSATQEEIFSDTQPLIRSVLDGFNVCIFAYGQTGSGKTYTMSGPSSLSQQDWGVNYRALDDLFQISQSRKNVISYEVGVQMIEIYNEQVRDLLFIDSSNRRLEIRNNSQLNGLNVPDACMLRVNSTTDVLKLMKIGQKNRAVGATALNERSSRSHSVLTVHVRGTESATGSILHGCLHLVDLAGSERVDRSEARGERLKEAQHINKSLSALGDVISALAQKNSHVPYRNSKLTQLLQDSLGGQAKTLMFVHISPDAESYGETVSTLKFAERVASVELGSARRNKESRDLHDLKEQVAMLREIVSKKDLEVERLQSMRFGSQDYLPGPEKPKSKMTTFRKSLAEAQDLRTRRQTIDTAGHKEKRLTGKLFHNHGAEEYDAVSASSPMLLSGSDGEISTISFSNVSSQKKAKELDADMDLVKQKEGSKEPLESEPSKYWRQSSPESSVIESVDDAWDTFHSEKINVHYVPETEVTSPHLKKAALEDIYGQVTLPGELFTHDSSDIVTGFVSEHQDAAPRKVAEIESNLDFGHQEKESDTVSDLSEGDNSVADSETSFSSRTEHKTFRMERDRGLEKNRSQRKLPQTQRGEWMSLNGVETYGTSRRHSTAVPDSWSGHSTSKKPPSFPLRRTGAP